jgi:hypothetical protein
MIIKNSKNNVSFKNSKRDYNDNEIIERIQVWLNQPLNIDNFITLEDSLEIFPKLIKICNQLKIEQEQTRKKIENNIEEQTQNISDLKEEINFRYGQLVTYYRRFFLENLLIYKILEDMEKNNILNRKDYSCALDLKDDCTNKKTFDEFVSLISNLPTFLELHYNFILDKIITFNRFEISPKYVYIKKALTIICKFDMESFDFKDDYRDIFVASEKTNDGKYELLITGEFVKIDNLIIPAFVFKNFDDINYFSNMYQLNNKDNIFCLSASQTDVKIYVNGQKFTFPKISLYNLLNDDKLSLLFNAFEPVDMSGFLPSKYFKITKLQTFNKYLNDKQINLILNSF